MFFILTLFEMFLFLVGSLGIGYAHSSLHEPVATILYPVPPSYVFLDPGVANTTVTLGPSRTSANVSIVASNIAQLVKNPQFYYNPDYWYCSPGSSLDCYWLASDTGSVGGVIVINGTVPALSYDSASIFQEITMPDSPIVSAYINITLRYNLASRVLTDWFVGLYDPSTGSFYAYYGTTRPSTYTTYTINASSVVEPGKTYYIVAGVEVLTLFRNGTVDFRIDSIYLNVTTLYYTFSNTVLGINASSSTSPQVYARLIVDSATLDPGLNASIKLINVSNVGSTSITITNGVLNSTSTSWIKLSPTLTGYSSGYIWLNVSKTTLVNSTLQLYLELCTGALPGSGACAYYPVQLVIDPSPGHRAAHNPHAIVLEARKAPGDKAYFVAEAIKRARLVKVDK